jgi:hypothetical protein
MRTKKHPLHRTHRVVLSSRPGVSTRRTLRPGQDTAVFLNGSLHLESLTNDSARALIVDMPLMSDSSFVRKGMRPHRMRISSRKSSSRSLRITGWKVEGAML